MSEVQSAYDLWVTKQMVQNGDSIRGTGVISSGGTSNIITYSATSGTVLPINSPTIQDIGIATSDINSVAINNNKVVGITFGSGSNLTYYKNINNTLTQTTSTDYATIELMWDGSIASSFSSGDGTLGNPYIITKGSEIAYIAQQVNAGTTTYSGVYFKIGNNINLGGTINWIPIGKTSVLYFKGILDGDNKIIEGLYYDSNAIAGVGLFGYIDGGTVKNIRIENSYINNSYSAASSTTAAFCAIFKSGTIDNCYTKATIKSSNSSTTNAGMIGGIAGLTAGIISNCTNEGYINSTSKYPYVGGIAGKAQPGVITGCTNLGNIDLDLAAGLFSLVGGIVGVSGTSTGPGSVTYCSNFGNIRATSYNSTYNCVAGIVGFCGSGGMVQVSYCYNKGDVYGYNQSTLVQVGGIAGQTKTTGSVLSYSYSKGKIDVGTSTNSYTGGVLGAYSNGITASKWYFLSTAYTGVIAAGDGVSVSDDIDTYADFLTWIATK